MQQEEVKDMRTYTGAIMILLFLVILVTITFTYDADFRLFAEDVLAFVSRTISRVT